MMISRLAILTVIAFFALVVPGGSVIAAPEATSISGPGFQHPRRVAFQSPAFHGAITRCNVDVEKGMGVHQFHTAQGAGQGHGMPNVVASTAMVRQQGNCSPKNCNTSGKE